MEFEFAFPPDEIDRPASYNGVMAPVYERVFDECQNLIRAFDFSKPDNLNISLSYAVELTIKPCMLDIKPLHAYIEHIANSGHLFTLIEESRDYCFLPPASVENMAFSSRFLEATEGRRSQRHNSEYVLTEKEYAAAREDIARNPEISRIIHVIQSVAFEHFSNMSYHFQSNMEKCERFTVDQVNVIDKIALASKDTFLEELLPSLMHIGLSDDIQKTQSRQDMETVFQKGLMESFRLSAFRVQEMDAPRKCPFSSGAVQLWSTVLEANEHGVYRISPQMKPGAFPAFIACHIRNVPLEATSAYSSGKFTP